jgi:hypothetical protein
MFPRPGSDPTLFEKVSFVTCAFRKSYPDVMVVQSRQDWDGDNDTSPLDCPT